MKLLWILPLLVFGGTQDYTVTAAQAPTGISVKWTAPETHDNKDWIALYRVGAPAEPLPPETVWKYVPPGTGGELQLANPGVGEWEARYFLRDGFTLAATSAKIVVVATEPIPDPAPDPPPVVTPEVMYYYEITYTNGTTIRGVDTNAGFPLVERWYNSALRTAGTGSLRAWKMEITKPDRVPDVELSGTIRVEGIL